MPEINFQLNLPDGKKTSLYSPSTVILEYLKPGDSLKKVLSGELALMFCFLAVALFNTFNAGTIVDGGPPPPFWIVLIVNPLLCIYGLVKKKK